jgi:hypothetical protein
MPLRHVTGLYLSGEMAASRVCRRHSPINSGHPFLVLVHYLHGIINLSVFFSCIPLMGLHPLSFLI